MAKRAHRGGPRPGLAIMNEPGLGTVHRIIPLDLGTEYEGTVSPRSPGPSDASRPPQPHKPLPKAIWKGSRQQLERALSEMICTALDDEHKTIASMFRMPKDRSTPLPAGYRLRPSVRRAVGYLPEVFRRLMEVGLLDLGKEGHLVFLVDRVDLRVKQRPATKDELQSRGTKLGKREKAKIAATVESIASSAPSLDT